MHPGRRSAHVRLVRCRRASDRCQNPVHPRIVDSASSWWPVPLPDPNKLITCSGADKANCMERSNDGEQSQCQDLCMTDEVPLAYFQRQGVLFKELMHQTDAARLISFSPNDVNFLVTAVELRLFTVAIVKSTDHLSVIQKARFLFQEGLGFRVHHLPSGALRRGASSHQDFRHTSLPGWPGHQ